MKELQTYMGSGYQRINPQLLGLTKKTGDLAAMCEKIDRQLEECQPVKEGLKVWRKAGLLTDYKKPFKKGEEFTQAAYLSTSKDPKYVKDAKAGQVVFEIECGKYSAARDVGPVRNNAKEAEILFHRNAKFKIVDVQTKGGVTWVKMKEVDSEAGYVWGAHKVTLEK